MAYANLSQADTYHSGRLSAAAWSALSSNMKLAAIESASDALDLYAERQGGWKQDYREFPPEGLVRACCEEALTLTDPTNQARLKAQSEGVTSISIGSASESYGGKAVATGVNSVKALALIGPYLKRRGGSVPIV